jgi:hypothetical protein
MENNFIKELNRNSKAKYRAKMFQFLLENAHHGLPFTVTAEQETLFKNFLAERVASIEDSANKLFGN